MASEFLDFLASTKPKVVDKSADEDLKLNEAERAYLHLNSQPNFYFRYPMPADLRTITDKFPDEECFKLLSSNNNHATIKIVTILGNANGTLKVQTKNNVAFNTHEFLMEKMVSRQYFLDIVLFPDGLSKSEESEAMRVNERLIRVDPIIKRKKHLLDGKGITYIIHYNGNKIANQVIEDVRNTSSPIAG